MRKDIKKGKMSPAKAYRESGSTSYGKSANVRESTAMSFAKPRKGKKKAGAYASYS